MPVKELTYTMCYACSTHATHNHTESVGTKMSLAVERALCKYNIAVHRILDTSLHVRAVTCQVNCVATCIIPWIHFDVQKLLAIYISSDEQDKIYSSQLTCLAKVTVRNIVLLSQE